MTMPLEEGQFSVGGVVFGRGCPVEVSDFLPGAPDAEENDTTRPFTDGTVFGIDRQAGPVHTWELNTSGAYTAAECLSAWQQLAAAWNNPALRSRPRAVTELRARVYGGEEVVCFGRPRALDAVATQLIRAGVVEFSADFRAVDSSFYSATPESDLILDLVTSGGGGVTWPVTWPITWGESPGQRQDALHNPGPNPVWPVITIEGPVAQPSISILGTDITVYLDATLAYDQTVTIDPRPWAGTVLRNDGASLRGQLSGSRLSQLQVPVGTTYISFRGTDPTGTARAVVSWQRARSTP
ncbi:hypothetical protein [Nocardiopsis alba]